MIFLEKPRSRSRGEQISLFHLRSSYKRSYSIKNRREWDLIVRRLNSTLKQRDITRFEIK